MRKRKPCRLRGTETAAGGGVESMGGGSGETFPGSALVWYKSDRRGVNFHQKTRRKKQGGRKNGRKNFVQMTPNCAQPEENFLWGKRQGNKKKNSHTPDGMAASNSQRNWQFGGHEPT